MQQVWRWASEAQLQAASAGVVRESGRLCACARQKHRLCRQPSSPQPPRPCRLPTRDPHAPPCCHRGANPLLLDAEGRTPIAIAEAKGLKAAAAKMRAAARLFTAEGAALGDSPRDERIPAVRSSPVPAADTLARDSLGLRSFESHLSGGSCATEASGSHRSAAPQAAFQAARVAPSPAKAPLPMPAAPPAKQQAQQAQPPSGKQQAQQARPPSSKEPPAGKQQPSGKPAKQLSTKTSFLSWKSSGSGSSSSAPRPQIIGAFGYPSWDARLASLVEEEQPGGRRFVGLISELDSLAGAALARGPGGGAAQPSPRRGGWAAPLPEESVACHAYEAGLELAMAEEMGSQCLDDFGSFPDDLSTTMAMCGDGMTMLACKDGGELQTTLAFSGQHSVKQAAEAAKHSAQPSAAPGAEAVAAGRCLSVEGFLAVAAERPAPVAPAAPAALAAPPAKKRAAAPAASAPRSPARKTPSAVAPAAAAPKMAPGFSDDFLQRILAAGAARSAAQADSSGKPVSGTPARRVQQAKQTAERPASRSALSALPGSTACTAAAVPADGAEHRAAPTAAAPDAAASSAPWWMQPHSHRVEVVFT